MSVSPTSPGIRMSDADVPTLIAAWQGAVEAVHALAASTDAAGWHAPTECPGWSVGDVVAHVVAIESDVAGHPDHGHEPDWGALPHVRDDVFARYTEIGVDLRRGRPQADVVAELAAATSIRVDQLVHGSTDPDEVVRGPGGLELPRQRLLRMRTFDTWVHVQDIRRALHRPGDLGTAAAWVSAGQLLTALPYVLGKVLAAPSGTSVRVEVGGPVWFTRTVRVGDDGRAGFVPNGDHPTPTASITTDWVSYERLGCGRITPSHADVVVHGDTRFAESVLAALAITP